MNNRRAWLSTAAMAATLLSWAPLVRAEFPPAEVRREHPTGLYAGVAVGGGDLSCDGPECDATFDEAGSFSAHVGKRLTPQLSILADVWWMAHSEDEFTLTQGIFTIGLRYYLHPRFWIQGGLGGARASLTYDGPVQLQSHTDTVPGAQLGLGFDVLATRGGGFAMDVQLRVGTGTYDDDQKATNTALQVGFTWQ